MASIIYDKLVRDRIPEIIENSGKRCETETLSNRDYVKKLDEKLGEELDEYLQAHNIEELADLLEVVLASAEAQGCSGKKLEEIRNKKAKERGGFEKKILLKEVIE